MTAELGMNLAGVERVFALEAELAAMTRKLAGLEQRARERAAEEERLENVRRECGLRSCRTCAAGRSSATPTCGRRFRSSPAWQPELSATDRNSSRISGLRPSASALTGECRSTGMQRSARGVRIAENVEEESRRGHATHG